MNKVLRDCIPDITMPFLDDISIKGCPVEEKDETLGTDGCRRFVATHIDDCEKVLQRLEDARLTFSGEKSELFDRLGVKLSLTTAYNPEANGKVERGHGPIAKSVTSRDCYLMLCGQTGLRTVR